jgi:hypothetical protein
LLSTGLISRQALKASFIPSDKAQARGSPVFFIERHCAKLEIKILPLLGARFLGSRTLAILQP